MTAEELHHKIYEKGMLEDWSKITVDRWRGKLTKLKVGKTGELYAALKYSIRPDRITFSFPYYGRFVDMGVGKGVKIGDVKAGRSTSVLAGSSKSTRRPKKWYSKTMSNEVRQLAKLLAQKYGSGSAEFIKQSLTIPIVIES